MLHDKYCKKDTNPIYPAFCESYPEAPLPKYELPPDPIPAAAAARLIRDELMDEGNARLNLATFCQTFMEKDATDLMSETLAKNSIDKSEYPRTAELENRCVNIIARLWHTSESENFIGTSTEGSSEACMLCGLAMKFRWKKRTPDWRTRTPNLVISSGYQVCWEKFCRYWDVELRAIPMSRRCRRLPVQKALEACDANTIGIVGILGITYTGEYDEIALLDAEVSKYNQTSATPIFIHVDAASGGFFAPFVEPELVWDFRLKNVVSINASGHKYGLVYPGVGWAIWRDRQFLPEELIFRVSYLGGSVETMALNFSRSASQIIGQYYNFLRFGRSGYERIHRNTLRAAAYVADRLDEMGRFDLLNRGERLPVLCFTQKETSARWSLYDLSDRLRMRGWLVPTYPLPPSLEECVVQRFVFRADFGAHLAEELTEDIARAVEELDSAAVGSRVKKNLRYGFTH
ncbi:MAG: glutamate decarboxylase [Planctomycetia bacterium]|nr:glutamate decarboxylase [Planctomycetia bacterium]